VRLYHFPTSPNCLKVRAVAYEIGVELELATVNIFKSESRSATFRALNPNSLVPVLVDGDFVLWESNAILTDLASRYESPALISTDARGRADPSRLDAEVAVRLSITGHSRGAIAKAIKEAAQTDRPNEKRD
jgi:glutathione S-transferase